MNAPDYNEWIDSKKDDIFNAYLEQIDFPEEIYEGVLDDDYQDAEESYLETITFDDVSDDFISTYYENEATQ